MIKRFKNNKSFLAIPAILLTALGGITLENLRVKEIKEDNTKELELRLSTLVESTERWNSSNVLALKTLASQPDIISMDASTQKPVLESLVNNYDRFYLAFTMNTDGENVARSDNNKPKNYADRHYFRSILLGKNLAYQTLIGRSNNLPTLCMSSSVKDHKTLVGAAVACSNLETISSEIGSLQFGKTGTVYLVDPKGHLLAHPNTAYLRGTELRDVSSLPPIQHLLEGRKKSLTFLDSDGRRWISYGSKLINGWGIVVVVDSEEIIPSNQTQIIIGAIAAIISLFLFLNGLNQRNEENLETGSSEASSETGDSTLRNTQSYQIGRIANPRTKNNQNSLQSQDICLTQQGSNVAIVRNELSLKKQGKQILIAHFNPVKRNYYFSIFSEAGFGVTTTKDGESALNLVTNEHFDLILTGLFLEKISSGHLARAIRNYQKYAKTPILAVSDSQSQLETTKCLHKNFDCCLAEPIEGHKLIATAQKYLHSFTRSTRIIEFPKVTAN